MAKIKKIKLNNFRNFKKFELSFNPKTNILFGDNGSGKTNILESISLISKGRGIKNSQLANFIRKNEKKFLISSQLEIDNNSYDIDIFNDYKDDKYKKFIKVNNDSSKESLNFVYSSLSFLYFLPEMERLFQASPSSRRNFIDRFIFSYDKEYNKLINKYKKFIFERSKILKNSHIDLNWINFLENEISEHGLKIYEFRQKQLINLNKQIKDLNSLNKYEFKIELNIQDSFYNSDLNLDNYLLSLYNSRESDKILGGAKIGPHKSDIDVRINDTFDASNLSTGQQKTVVLMLILAQCNFLINQKKIQPILLLDEICSHLDVYNRKLLSDMINNLDIQFFLTGTEKSLFSFISTNVNFYNITDL